ncbi:uncharacterized protein FJT64_019937 [Amphibalanus amphitrite]|uniref:RNA-directed DNA polymerase n=1 Tax=Amphibalanus amphitrite TaxID=1232801 RepID=A0A6A4WYJ2_AMPAM|nr:uncharacterized protein FJT64_019937 [Amphibalanus amphitrite]
MVLPANESVAPLKMMLPPLKVLAPPLKQMMPPLKKMMPPLKKMMPPLKKMMPSLKKMMPPLNVMVLPANESVAPLKMMLPPLKVLVPPLYTSLREFTVWTEKVKGYFLLTGAGELHVKGQRAALLSLLDEDWHRVIRFGLDLTEDATPDTVMNAMEGHLRKQRNVLVDRREFYGRVQEPGERFDEFLYEIKELASFFEIQLMHQAGSSTLKCTPDTGAEATVMGDAVARSIGIDLSQLQTDHRANFTAVGQRPLDCLGAFGAALRLGDRSADATVYVISGLTGTLLSWFDSVALGILPADFPAQIPNATQHKTDGRQQMEDGARLAPLVDPSLERIRAAADRDPEYESLRETILHGFPEHRHEVPPSVRPYWGVRGMLALDGGLIVYGPRLVIPARLRRDILDRLHQSHQGIERTKRRARLCVYWPGIDRDVTNVVSSCPRCRQLVPSHANEPLWREDDQPSPPHLPGEDGKRKSPLAESAIPPSLPATA